MNSTSQTNNCLYNTSDLGLAVALSLQFPIKDVDCLNPQRACFYFDAVPDLMKATDSYWEGSMRVNPQAYFNQIKVLKARLYANREAHVVSSSNT